MKEFNFTSKMFENIEELGMIKEGYSNSVNFLQVGQVSIRLEAYPIDHKPDLKYPSCPVCYLV